MLRTATQCLYRCHSLGLFANWSSTRSESIICRLRTSGLLLHNWHWLWVADSWCRPTDVCYAKDSDTNLAHKFRWQAEVEFWQSPRVGNDIYTTLDDWRSRDPVSLWEYDVSDNAVHTQVTYVWWLECLLVDLHPGNRSGDKLTIELWPSHTILIFASY